MDAQEYKQRKAHGDVLDFTTLDTTRRILAQRSQVDLAAGIDRVLSDGRIDKPILHVKQKDQYTDFYRVDFADADIERIVSALFALEAEAAVADDEASAARYAGLVDRWHDLMEQRSGK